MIEHIVMIKVSDSYKAETKLKKAQELKKLLENLPEKIEEIITYEIGLNISTSPNAYDLVLVSSFKSLEALEVYRVHAEHQKVLKKIKEYASSTTVVDYKK
ncbi:MAG: Dabb family protein [Bacteroidota bacterium]